MVFPVLRAPILLLSFLMPASLLADVENDKPVMLSRACETALALSAGPEHIRDKATVYVLGDNGYEQIIQGTGPFHCIVTRGKDRGIEPQCMDAVGATAILPSILERAAKVMQGVPMDEVNRLYEQDLRAGNVLTPDRPGVNFMLSEFNYIYVEQAGGILHVEPHVMFYAPNLSTEDIGGMPDAEPEIRGLPRILGEGPHAYMITYTDSGSDSTDVVENCPKDLISR